MDVFYSISIRNIKAGCGSGILGGFGGMMLVDCHDSGEGEEC